jgi:hypothetical protein
MGVGVYERVLPVVAAPLLAKPVFGQEARRTAVIWHDRGDAAALDIVSGAGGKDQRIAALTGLADATVRLAK